jgi:hypothetical protein
LESILLTQKEEISQTRITRAKTLFPAEAAGWLVVPIGAVLSAGVPYAVYFLGGLTMVRAPLLVWSVVSRLFFSSASSFPSFHLAKLSLFCVVDVQADPYAQAVAYYGLSAFLVRPVIQRKCGDIYLVISCFETLRLLNISTGTVG